jgi:ribose transport system ATP-binding protein
MRSLMIGRDLSDHYYREDLSSTSGDDVVIQVESISFGSTLKDISFELHKGEILGIGGLTDCGMHELCKILFGLIKPNKGKVTVFPIGKIIKNSNDAIKNKIAYIPKNREQEAMMPSASIKDNIVLMSYDKLSKGPIISPTREVRFAKEQADLLQIKMVSIDQFCLFLSGGNKQKVVISKWIANDSEILIMDCPTRGIDVGVKAAIYQLMEELIKSGKSIIMVSEELPELLGMSDRIIILKDGCLSAIFERGIDWNEEKVIQAII